MPSLSVWEKESFFAQKDVIIIGSGLAGMWCAYYLKKKKPRLSVTIVDRGIIPTGASTRNAGFACFGSVTELLDDTSKMGKEEMLELVEMRYRGLERITQVLGEKPIGYTMCGGYELIMNEDKNKVKKLEDDIHWLNKVLNKITKQNKTFRFSDKKIDDFGFRNIHHLLENKLEAHLHSGKLCVALLQKIQSMGVTVLNGIEVSAYEKIGDKIAVYTRQDLYLTANRILICTNAFTKELIPDIDIVPARGQILVTSEIPDLRFRGTFHFDEGFYYFRDLGKRVLLGGARNKAFEEETTTELAVTEKIQAELEDFLRNYILPDTQFEITDRWSGIMAMGSKKMPILEEISDDVFCAVRMSGMGVALAPVMGEKMARKLAGN
jgi:glycine/D-amino acid oxidase-like deaminating enzyme